MLPTLSAREVRAILRSWGFEIKATRGSHEQWEGKKPDGQRTIVTVDQNAAPFTRRSAILKSMIRQSGRTKREWEAAHCG